MCRMNPPISRSWTERRYVLGLFLISTSPLQFGVIQNVCHRCTHDTKKHSWDNTSTPVVLSASVWWSIGGTSPPSTTCYDNGVHHFNFCWKYWYTFTCWVHTLCTWAPSFECRFLRYIIRVLPEIWWTLLGYCNKLTRNTRCICQCGLILWRHPRLVLG